MRGRGGRDDPVTIRARALINADRAKRGLYPLDDAGDEEEDEDEEEGGVAGGVESVAVGAGGFQSSGGSEGDSDYGEEGEEGGNDGGEGELEGAELEAAAAAEAASMMAGISCEGGCDFSTSGTGRPGDPVVISARGGGAKRDVKGGGTKRVKPRRVAGKRVAKK